MGGGREELKDDKRGRTKEKGKKETNEGENGEVEENRREGTKKVR